MPRPAPQPAKPRLDPHPARARVEPPMSPPRTTGGGRATRGLALLAFLIVIGGGGFFVYQQFRGPGADRVDAADDWAEPLASSNPADDGVATDSATGDANRVAGGLRNEASSSRQSARTPAPGAEPDGPTPEPTLRTLPAATPPSAPDVGDPEAASALLRDFASPSDTVASSAVQPTVATPVQPVPRPPSRPRWAQRASGRDLSDAYPAGAARRNVEGRVVLDCLIGASLAIVCRVTSETPAGQGFAAAAMRVAQKYRSGPTMEDGRPAAGERTTIAISFKPAT